ncbi:MAG: hypothetical protein ACRC9Q_04140 [Bacteroidales bacterium]
MNKFRIPLFISVCLGTGILNSCKRSAEGFAEEKMPDMVESYDKDSFYYCGYFVFADDSSYFEDCATGNRFHFVENNRLDTIRQCYEEMSDSQHVPLFGSMHGSLHYDQLNKEAQIEVIHFKGFNEAEGCNPGAVMSDEYSVVWPGKESPEYEIKIQLHANYEFVWSEYDYKSRSERSMSGKWGRINEEDILFKIKGAEVKGENKYKSAFFDFSNMQLMLDSVVLHRS